MDTVKIVELKEGILQDKNEDARQLRKELQSNHILFLNVMSSPGSGKTTTIVSIIKNLDKQLHVGVMEADIDSDVDAKTVQQAGAKSIQLHTGGMCHLDSEMVRQGINELGTKNVDVLFLENIGNLVCPAEFDTGSTKNVVILSVPEGDDKPLKYSLMFSVADIVVINKIDTLSYFDFDLEKFEERVRKINNKAKIIKISAKTGEGVKDLCDWIEKEYRGL